MGVTVNRICGVCEEPFQAHSKLAKFCSQECRNRSKTKPVQVEAPRPTTGGGVTAETAKTLARLNKLDTPQGAAALVVASRLDFDTAASANGVAALSKELCRVMEAIEADVPAAADPLDELRKRREARRGA